jgi:hypothetical protein
MTEDGTRPTVLEAYKAMLLFWDEIALRTESSDVAAALAELKLTADDTPMDRARLHDFEILVQKVMHSEDLPRVYYRFDP